MIKHAPVFGSSFEMGLRATIILYEWTPKSLNFDALSVLTYAMVHSGDFPGLPPSMHINVKGRNLERYARHDTLAIGLSYMTSMGFVDKLQDCLPDEYICGENAASFLSFCTEEYSQNLKLIAHALHGQLENEPSSQIVSRLSLYIPDNKSLDGDQ